LILAEVVNPDNVKNQVEGAVVNGAWCSNKAWHYFRKWQSNAA
jgi:hypothetical protein